MKIGFDAKRAFVNRSGLGNYSRDLIRSLYDFVPENEYVLFSPDVNYNLIEKKYAENIVTTERTSAMSKNLWRSFGVTNSIINNKIDIYHGLSNELPFNISNARKVKKIVSIHDLIFISNPQLYKSIDRIIYARKSFKSCNNADIIIATSEYTKKEIIKYFKIPESRIEVVYQSCNSSFSLKYTKEEKESVKEKYDLPEKFILTVGTIERRKNVLNIIKAINQFKLDVNYLVVGRKTEYLKEILDYVSENKLENKIFIKDNISNADLPIVYQMAEIFVFPSYVEGFGIPILEAFSSQIPTITANQGSPAEIAGDAALQVDVLDVEHIADAIKNICSSDIVKSDLINKANKRLQLFDREVLAKEINEIYKSLL